MRLASMVDFFNRFRRAVLGIGILVLMGGAIWWVMLNLDTELKTVDILTDGDLALDPALETAAGEQETGGAAFFAGYRLQRERIRDQSIEMLQLLLDNQGADSSAREEAEELLLEVVRLRELELIVENMIRAQGYEDAVFFYHDNLATVLVKELDLDEKSFLQISETVAGAVGVERENSQAMARPKNLNRAVQFGII